MDITVTQTEDFAEWLKKLRDRNAAAIIAARIGRVSRGLLGDVEPVGEGVSELRVDVGPGYRVYFTKQGDAIIILLCGGDKSSQQRDITKAKKLASTL